MLRKRCGALFAWTANTAVQQVTGWEDFNVQLYDTSATCDMHIKNLAHLLHPGMYCGKAHDHALHTRVQSAHLPQRATNE